MFLNLFKASNQERYIIPWACAGLVVFVSSFVWSPSRDGLEIIYLFAFLLPVFFIIVNQKYDFVRCGGWFTATALAYASYSLLSSLWAGSGFGFLLMQFVLLFFWLVGAAWLMCNRGINLDKMYNVLIVAGCIISLYTVISFYVQGYQNGYHLEVRLSCWCSARNPNLLGGVFGILSLLSYIKFIGSKSAKEITFFAITTAILFLPLMFSQSRGAILAFVITAFAAFLLLRPAKNIWLLQLLVIVPALLAFLLLADIPQIYLNRATAMGDRSYIWGEIIRRIGENFFFGIGLSKDTKIDIANIETFNHAHSAWLDIFYRTGAVGFLLMMAHFITLLFNFKKNEKYIYLQLWLVFGCIFSIFDSRGFFWQIDTKWFFYWIPAGLLAGLFVSEQGKNEQEPNDRDTDRHF